MRRRAFALMEMFAAFALTGVLIVLSVQLMVAATTGRRAIERRTIALEEAANLAEKIAAMPWEQITADDLADVQLSPAVQAILPKASLKTSVEPSTDPLPVKRVRIEITWDSTAGRPESPVALEYWAFESVGGQQP